MKKFLTLTLVFLMLLAVAMPALAFSAVEPEEDDDSIPYELDIYLVEYEDEDDLGLPVLSLPPSDRGYAKNEIVCAISKLYVPKKEDPYDDGYVAWIMSGDNMKLEVAERAILSTNLSTGANQFWRVNDDNEFYITVRDGRFYNDSKNQTYALAFFAKVTGDDAFLNATLTKEVDFSAAGELLIDKYVVDNSDDEDYTYVIYGTEKDNNGDLIKDADKKIFAIETNSKDASKALYVYLTDANAGASNAGGWWRVGVDSTGYYFSSEDDSYIDHDPKDIYRLDHVTIEQESDAKRAYNTLMDIVEDVFEDDFGFSYDYIGNVINDKTFIGVVAADDLFVEVAIEPWYAYVEVPPEI
ncbi:hypothetical protein LJC07_05590, partial [Christensenellaceae bacterium OttesenSCG-928-L17]|nr:hypothetical protein [Christensenellaceae bacterium OttesenSCG-928-L17]